ncbi:hypothetical protein JXA85_00420 [Candidatus Woesearchaeota archaeon]|nr:hypothetical protein [Candidatus Woesearchaeota archaeon]
MRTFLLLSIILAVLVSACNPYTSMGQIPYENVDEGFNRCIRPWEMQENYQGEFVIDSQEEYEALLEYKATSSKCDDFELPPIDFSQKTLLGKYTSGTGCEIGFSGLVYKDDNENKVYYVIDVAEEGNCQALGISMNWALIPKVHEGYEVVFEVK